MVNVIMHGCNGKMGRVITNLVSQDNDIEIVAGVDAYTGIDNEYPVFTSIKECTVKADVIIDFAVTSAIDNLLDYSVSTKTPVPRDACMSHRTVRSAVGISLNKA